jgi:membrane fusion protein (multidrug efflux system)
MTIQVAAANAAPIKVETYTVKAEPFKEKVSLIGTLKAKREAVLTAPASGILTQIFVSEGSKVKKGQLLAEMDTEGLKTSLSDLRISVKNKRSRLARVKTLYKQGDLSLKDLEDAQTDLASTERNYHDLEHKLHDAQFKAPFAGECGVFRAETGAQVQSGSPVVAVYDTSELLVYFSVPENLLKRLQLGQSIWVKEHEAKLSSLENRLNPKTNQAYAKATLSKCDNCLIGSKIPVELKFSGQALSIPAESVFIRDKKSYVFRVIEGKAQQTPVTTGTRSNKQIAILSGLAAGDIVILRGQSKISHDDSVY